MTQPNIPIEIMKHIENLKNDFSSGSTAIAREALKILGYSVSKDIDTQYTGKLLINAKPAMAAPKNIINFALRKFKTDSNTNKYVCEQIFRLMDKAKEEIINTGINNIFEKGKCQKIITCSYSGTIVDLLRLAKKSGAELEVLAIESYWKGQSYGKKMAGKCMENGIMCTVVPDNDIPTIAGKGSAILTGADMIISSGGIVNGIPSLELARHNAGKIPFYVLAESFKYSDHPHTEDGFCFVPPEFITFVISDNLFE